MSPLRADLVLQGGGVKGLGLVGAARRLLRAGYAFPRVAGTSAGSIVGAFLAAGVTEAELPGILDRLEFSRVPDRGPPWIPVLSEGLSLVTERGLYEGDYIHDYLRRELEVLGVETFADLRRADRGADRDLPPERRYALVVMATDVTNGRLLRLPWDYPLLGLDPDEQLVADAVRASIAIPFYFEPVVLRDETTGKDVTLVDGGVLSNFPIEIFDRTDGKEPRWPTFGVRIIPDLPQGDPTLFPGVPLPRFPPVDLLEQVVATAIVGNDQTYLERPCVRRRAFDVDTSEAGVIEFGISRAKRDRLVENGDAAAAAFLATWDWDAYKRECRS